MGWDEPWEVGSYGSDVWAIEGGCCSGLWRWCED